MSVPKTFKMLYGADKPGEKHKFVDESTPELQKNQVLVKMEFAPMNPSDVHILTGVGNYGNLHPHPVGLEGSGTIAAVGPDLKVQHKVGDRVHVYAYGTYGEYVVAEADYCSPILGDLSFEDAASHFINPATVYYMGKLAQEHKAKAAIHTAGSSALGRILIRYFKHLGIKLINIVRNAKYIDELKAEGADYVFDSTAADFEEKLKEVAHKENATFALDAISGDFTSKIIKALPPHSIVYVYGLLSGNPNINVYCWDLLKYKKLSALIIFDYVAELREKGELEKFWEEVHKLLPTYFSTKIEKVYKVADIEEAVKYYDKNASKGKILITPK